MAFGIGGAFEAALPPRSHMVAPGRMAAGRRHGRRGWGPRLRVRLSGPLFGRGDDADVVAVAEHLTCARRGAGLGREVAHRALDHARVAPSLAPLGRDGED